MRMSRISADELTIFSKTDERRIRFVTFLHSYFSRLNIHSQSRVFENSPLTFCFLPTHRIVDIHWMSSTTNGVKKT